MGVMTRVAGVVAALVAGHGLFGGAAGEAAVVVNNLLVRVYDTAGVPEADRRRAFARANEILARVELDAAWLECPAGGLRAPSTCADPPGPGELVLRVVRSTAAADERHPHALGYSLVDTRSGAGTLATVFIDRVDRLARHARGDRAAILGRAMAHEIGHLVLGHTRHSPSGLMREHWTVEEVRRDRPEDWHFTRAEGESLHAAIQAAAADVVARRGASGSGGQNPYILLNKTP